MKTSLALVAKIFKKEQAKIAKSRDVLRELRDNIDGQIESCDRALATLDETIDTLSELV